MLRIRNLIASLSIIGIGIGNAQATDAAWEIFLKNPSIQEGRNLASALAVVERPCPISLIPKSDQIHRLTTLLRKRNFNALQPATLALRCLDSGNAEDLYRALGESFSADPNRFFTATLQDELTDDQFKQIVTMLPLRLVDKIDSQISELNRRILLVTKMKNAPDQRQLRTLAILIKQRDGLLEIQHQFSSQSKNQKGQK